MNIDCSPSPEAGNSCRFRFPNGRFCRTWVCRETRSAEGLLRYAVDDVIDYLCRVGRHHRIHFLWRPVLRDPRDDMVLELAVEAACDAIVTHNVEDFAGAVRFGILVLRPGAFLRRIGVIP